MNVLKKNVGAGCLGIAGLIFAGVAVADQQSDMAEMQRRLNAEVMEKPFSVEDEAKIDSYIASAMKKDLVPNTSSKPEGWRVGYTCADIYNVSWNAYQDCRYYRHYHGRYW